MMEVLNLRRDNMMISSNCHCQKQKNDDDNDNNNKNKRLKISTFTTIDINKKYSQEIENCLLSSSSSKKENDTNNNDDKYYYYCESYEQYIERKKIRLYLNLKKLLMTMI